jgi:16S rRNA (cytosine967-C5)-methyltransferase
VTPAARVQAAIELLDQIIEAASGGGAPADRALAEGFRARRYAGSKDRRAIRELVYGAIRACGPVPASGRAAMLRLAQDDPAIATLFDGSAYGPAPIAPDEQPAAGGIAPEWLEQALAASGVAGEEAAALLGRAPLDVRVNTLKAERDMIELPEHGEPLPAPNGVRFAHGLAVEQWEAYREGRIEVQDCGSQLACLAVGAKPGETVIDLCAGAGGKTLALAAAMENRGVLVASDTDRGRLARLMPRAERAGAAIAQTMLLDPGKELAALADWRGTADAVLVDAPCSGSGTWRRNPETRWRITQKRLAQLLEAQEHVLGIAAQLAKPGARVVYVTCSLLDAEGPQRIERFLAAHPGWTAKALDLPLGRPRGAGWRLSPCHDGTDGFFIAQLFAPC